MKFEFVINSNQYGIKTQKYLFNTLEALKNKQSEENATISELTDQLNALYSRLAALEDDSKLTRKNIQNAENSVVSLQGKNEAQ